jgi:hypothetical protein
MSITFEIAPTIRMAYTVCRGAKISGRRRDFDPDTAAQQRKIA